MLMYLKPGKTCYNKVPEMHLRDKISQKKFKGKASFEGSGGGGTGNTTFIPSGLMA